MMMTEMSWIAALEASLCMFGTDRVQGRTGPLILSPGRPRCSSAGQCQVWFICRGNAQPLYVQLIHQTKREHFRNAFFFARLSNWGLSVRGVLIDHNHIFSCMRLKGPRAWSLVRGTHGTFPLPVNADVCGHYLSSEEKLTAIFHFYRCHWSRSCPSRHRRTLFVMRNSFVSVLTDRAPLRGASASRWQYDTWICDVSNQDSSIITKNKHPDYFLWQVEINNKFSCNNYTQNSTLKHYFYILLQSKHLCSYAKSGIYRIKTRALHPERNYILLCSDFTYNDDFVKSKGGKKKNKIWLKWDQSELEKVLIKLWWEWFRAFPINFL